MSNRLIFTLVLLLCLYLCLTSGYPVQGQTLTANPPRAITLDFWCSEETIQLLRAEFKAQGYEIKTLDKPDEPMVIVGRRYITWEETTDGFVLHVFKVKPECSPDGDLVFDTIFHSKPSNLRSAVSEFLKEQSK